jgi:hypothetical protein
LSAALHSVAQKLPTGSLTVRDLISLVGEQGLLLLCIFMVIPFMIPVTPPGMSIPFGVAIVLIGVGVTLNRIPWLPRALLDRPVSGQALAGALEAGAVLVGRLDRIVKPRMRHLTDSAFMGRVNGLCLVLSGVLLALPLSLIPFSNTLPGLAIIFLSAGMLQRDGAAILVGCVFIALTLIYFALLALGVALFGQGILALLRSA